jgi:hypothetical protein
MPKNFQAAVQKILKIILSYVYRYLKFFEFVRMLQNQLPAAVASARPNTPHAPAQSTLALDLRNSPTQAPTPQAMTISAAPARNLLQMSPMRPPTQSDTAILDQSDAAILDQLNAFYLHYDQKNVVKASIVWRTLQVLFAENAATELEKALMIKYGSNLNSFAKGSERVESA